MRYAVLSPIHSKRFLALKIFSEIAIPAVLSQSSQGEMRSFGYSLYNYEDIIQFSVADDSIQVYSECHKSMDVLSC